MARFLSLFETAQMLGLKQTEVTELAYTGALPADRRGKNYLFEISDVSRYLRSVEGV